MKIQIYHQGRNRLFLKVIIDYIFIIMFMKSCD
jgi:hypothetical protein